MSDGIYKYNKTLELLREVANTTKIVSKKDLMMSMMNHVAKDKVEEVRFTTALSTLKQKAEKAGIALKLERSGNKKENRLCTYHVYFLSESSEQLNVVPKTEPKKDLSDSMNALQKNNQKLFIENENLSNEVMLLQKELEIMKAKESEYKNVIASFYALAMN